LCLLQDSYTGGIIGATTGCNACNTAKAKAGGSWDNVIDHSTLIVGYGTSNGVDYWLVRQVGHCRF
jgi:hypothetical protein